MITQEDWEERSEFYRSVGQAISMWASMEDLLVEIAALLLDTSEEKAGLLMYSIINFNVWLNIIDELFSIEPRYQTHKATWTAQSEKLRGMNDTRVRLAHHTVRAQIDNSPLALRPGRYDSRMKSRKHKPLTEAEIVAFGGQMIEVYSVLAALWKAMGETPH
jgi:hypothetical protein